MKFVNDVFDPNMSFEISESNDEVDGTHVLAKLVGNFFVPDGMSRNKRFYKNEVWQKQLSKPNIKSKITERRMLGTISHEQPINDIAVLEGKISHAVTKLEIREGSKGYGEALILNTPAGRILNTLARAGVKLFTSSRANGTYKGEVRGAPSVNPDTYQLEGFDFVLDPGFLQASPALKESVNESINDLYNLNNNKPEATNVDKELLESVIKENGSLKSDLKLSLKETESLKENNQEISDELAHLKEKLETLENNSALVEEYKKLGSVEDIQKVFEEAGEISEEYNKIIENLGSAESIELALTSAKDRLEEYKELGTPEKVEEALTKAKDLILEYQELGTVASIQQVFDRTKQMIEESKAIETSNKIKELAEELSVSEELIEKVYGKMTEDEVREFVTSLGESKVLNSKYRKNNMNENTKNTPEEKTSFRNKNSTQKMMERLAR